MSEINDIREAAVGVLLSRTCQSINLRYRGCRVDGSAYARVAEHLRAGRIHIQLRTLDDAGSGAKAQYDDDSDTLFVQHNFLLVPAFRRIFDEPACVHELTHAVYDDQALGLQLALDSEIIAYVAEAIFGVRTGLAYPDPTSNILRCARAIAASLPNGGAISETAAELLRRQLLTRQIYARQRDLRLRSGGIGTGA